MNNNSGIIGKSSTFSKPNIHPFQNVLNNGNFNNMNNVNNLVYNNGVNSACGEFK